MVLFNTELEALTKYSQERKNKLYKNWKETKKTVFICMSIQKIPKSLQSSRISKRVHYSCSIQVQYLVINCVPTHSNNQFKTLIGWGTWREGRAPNTKEEKMFWLNTRPSRGAISIIISPGTLPEGYLNSCCGKLNFQLSLTRCPIPGEGL